MNQDQREETEFKVGDGVVVVDEQDRATTYHQVESVGNGWVNCSSDLKFRPEKRKDIRKWRFGDGYEIERYKRALKLQDFEDWEKLTREEMDEVWRIVSKYRRKKA